ncbi:MAG: chorismate mutase [Spirochaetaceae bacterium]|jgi:chorismate mutase|nr:chorismate mutase [Spirochaetaceae bacterium]
MKRLVALRGAVQSENTEQDIAVQVTALYDELLRLNTLTETDIVSLIFSMTKDLDAKNPAAALRQSGRAAETALFAVQEADVQGGLERVIRAIMHCYLEEDVFPCHVYRNGAETLRPDRAVQKG